MRIPTGTEGAAAKGPEQLAFEKGREVAKFYEGIWEKLPPVLRNTLVDSNVVLTVGGAKPMTEFFPIVPEDSDIAELRAGVDKLNQALQEQNIGVRFQVHKEPFLAPNNLGLPRSIMIDVMSLEGYDKITQQSKIPGVLPFDKAGGFDALDSWRSIHDQGIQQAHQEGALPKLLDLDNLVDGLHKGYPDIAVLDYAQWLGEGRVRRIDYLYIPHTGIYDEAGPNYAVFPEHADHPTVLANVNELGSLLKGFYESEFHQRVSEEPEIAARQVKRES